MPRTTCCSRDGSLLGRLVLVTAGPDLRRHRRGSLHGQPVQREDGLRRGRGGGASRCAGDPRFGSVARAGAGRRRGRQGATCAGDARRPFGQRARDADIVIMAAAVADYMPEGGGAARQDREDRWAVATDARANAGHPGRIGRRQARREQAGARRLCRRERRSARARPRETGSESGRPDRRQRRLAGRMPASTRTSTPRPSSARMAKRSLRPVRRRHWPPCILDRAEQLLARAPR